MLSGGFIQILARFMLKENSNIEYPGIIRLLSFFWLIPLSYYFLMTMHYSTNLPGGEEVEIFVNDVRLMFEQETLRDILSVFFIQHAEHRPATIKLFSVISYHIFGEVNFNFLNFVGNTFLFIPMAVVAASLARNFSDSLLYLLPSMTLLASPVHHSCILWTSCSVSQYGSLFWGGLALFFACRPGLVAFLLFEFCAFWGYVTLGNGLIIIPLGFACLFFAQPHPLRNFFLFAHFLLSSVFIYLYFSDFQTYGIYETTFVDATDSWLRFVGNILLWQFSWVGSWSTFSDSKYVALFFGGAEVVLMLYLLFKYRLKLLATHGYVVFFMVYILLSISIASFQRSWLLPYEMVFQPRYKMYSLFLVSLLLLLVMSLIREAFAKSGKTLLWGKTVLVMTLPIAVFWSMSTLRFEPMLKSKFDSDMQCIEQWTTRNKVEHCGWTLQHKRMVKSAEKAGLINIRP
ncbi:MAG: hypothetical protein KDI30_12845 [Pseudomonadales bacterium]|nr:hypothetical protein [Pseudomonadales bacterium]